MLYLRMRDCRVVRFSPSRPAAPFVPPTIPLVSFNTCSMRARSDSSVTFEAEPCNTIGADLPIISGKAAWSSGPLLRTTDRSMTF